MSVTNNKNYLLYAWLICGVGALFYSYEYFLRILPSVMESSLRDHFALSATGFGFLSAFYYYAYVPMQLPAGVLMDRFGPRCLLPIACVICVAASFLFANTNLFHYAAVGRFFIGLGSAFGFVGVLKLATIWLPEDKLALAAGSASALGGLSASLGDVLFGKMVHSIGWQETIEWSAFAGIALTFILWFGVRDKKSEQESSGTIHNFKRSLLDLFLILRNPQIWVNGMYGCLVYLPTTVFAELWGIPYLTHAHGLSHSAAEFCNSLLFLGFTLGAPLNGYISDRLKRRKLPMLSGALGAAIVISIIIYVPGLNVMTLNILMVFLGLLYSSQSIVFAVGRELSPTEAAGTAIAATNMIVMLGAMFVQPMVGKLLDLSQLWHRSPAALEETGMNIHDLVHTAADYRLALTVIPIGIICAAVLTFFLRETYASTEDERNRG